MGATANVFRTGHRVRLDVSPSAFLIALHEAVGNEHLSVVNYLVLHGAELNTRNSRGLTPLGLLTSPAPTSGGTSGQEGGSAKGPTEQLLRELGAIQ